MREAFYAIYRSVPIKVLLNTLLAESVMRGRVKCTPKNVKPVPGNELSDIERKILDRIIFGQKSKIKMRHIIELKNFYLSECLDKGYFRKIPLMGYRKTLRFRKIINDNLKGSFNQDIVNYINSHDSVHLKRIVTNIDLIQYPNFLSKESSRIGLYKDRLAMQNAAVDHRFGIQHPPPGR